MSKHTPEPWNYAEHMQTDYIYADDKTKFHRSYNICEVKEQIQRPGMKEANAKRIVACVNACAGINPEGVSGLLEACKEALKFHDTLTEWTEEREMAKRLEKVIAKAEAKK